MAMIRLKTKPVAAAVVRTDTQVTQQDVDMVNMLKAYDVLLKKGKSITSVEVEQDVGVPTTLAPPQPGASERKEVHVRGKRSKSRFSFTSTG